MNVVPATRVAIIEDHAMMAQGLLAALSGVDDIEVVGLAGTLADGLALVSRERPDVVVTDFRLPDGDAPEVLPRLLAAHPPMRILVVSAAGDYRSVVRAMEAGAMGYLLKDQAIDELVQGIRAVQRGERAIAPPLVPKLLAQMVPNVGVAGRMSRREVEVLQFMADGLTTAQIAGRLQLSVNTVRNHIQGVLNRLGAHSQREAVALGLRQGLIKSPES